MSLFNWITLFLFLIGGVAGCIFGPRMISSAENKADRNSGIFILCGSIVVLILFILGLFSAISTSLEQHPEMDTRVIEDSSVLYLFNQIDSSFTPEDITKILGTDFYEISEDNSYTMRYPTSEYTLFYHKPDYIFVYFDKNGSEWELSSISWRYEESDVSLFLDLESSLRSYALGSTTIKSNNDKLGNDIYTADWQDYHLECNSHYISFSRTF